MNPKRPAPHRTVYSSAVTDLRPEFSCAFKPWWSGDLVLCETGYTLQFFAAHLWWYTHDVATVADTVVNWQTLYTRATIAIKSRCNCCGNNGEATRCNSWHSVNVTCSMLHLVVLQKVSVTRSPIQRTRNWKPKTQNSRPLSMEPASKSCD